MLSAGLAAVLVLGACTAADDDPPSGTPASPTDELSVEDVPQGMADYYGQDVTWEECQDGLECADVTVPLDHDDPGGATIELAVTRQATDDDARLGSLLLNPGGPGGSGTQMVSSAEMLLSEDLMSRYDVVGFDPRGVHRSAAVDCVTDAELDEQRSAGYDLETESGLEAYTESAEELAASCAENTGELLAHVDTESAARDLDVLRHVLGDEQLSYLGYSYGTMLGAVYADLFPERVGRLVLDGGLDPSLSSHEVALGQAQGFEEAVRAYAEDCLSGSGCPLSGDVDSAVDQVRTLLEVADATPLPTSSDRELTGPLAASGILLPLYEDELWPVLTEALRQAMAENDGSQLLYLADLSADRQPDGSYATNSQEAFPAINCLDYPVDGDLAQWQEQATELEEAAPTFGPMLGLGEVLCDVWPHESEAERTEVTADGSAPILVVGTTGDPATPYAWSEALADQLDAGRLLTYDGEGHTAYGRSNACVTEAVDGYLLEGTMPEEGLVC